jgi:hypothetical protein
MKLFEIDGDFNVILNKVELLLVPEFKKVIRSDRGGRFKGDNDGRKKYKATAIFKFIFLYCDIRSPYKEYEDIDKFQKALKDTRLHDDEVKDSDVKAAIAKYKELSESRMQKLLKSAYDACDKLREFYDNLDLDERDENSRLVYKPNDLITGISKLGETVKGLRELETQVMEELETNGKGVRGGARKGNREDPD